MVKRPIHRLTGESVVPEIDELAEEVIITIVSKDEIIVRILATPTDLEDLAIGHIICEGRGDIESLDVDGHEIEIVGNLIPRPSDDILTAACGACTTGEIVIPSGIAESTQKLRANIGEMMREMKENQPLFHITGGVHAASIFDEDGRIIVTREDIGRHNAFDKAIGACHSIGFSPKIIGLSGRVGWELVAKAIRSKIEIIVAVGAISSAAEMLARSAGLTLVGFATKQNPAIIGDLSRIIDKPSTSRND